MQSNAQRPDTLIYANLTADVRNRISGTVSRRYAGSAGSTLTTRWVSTLRRRLSDADKRQLQQDLGYAPTWVSDVIRSVTTPSVK